MTFDRYTIRIELDSAGNVRSIGLPYDDGWIDCSGRILSKLRPDGTDLFVEPLSYSPENYDGIWKRDWIWISEILAFSIGHNSGSLTLEIASLTRHKPTTHPIRYRHHPSVRVAMTVFRNHTLEPRAQCLRAIQRTCQSPSTRQRHPISLNC